MDGRDSDGCTKRNTYTMEFISGSSMHIATEAPPELILLHERLDEIDGYCLLCKEAA